MNEIASRYAYALYSLALEKDQLEERVKQIKELLDVLEDNGDFLLLLSNEFLSIEERQEVVHKALQGVNEDILYTIDIVIKNHRVKYLKEILQAFITDANSYQGVKEGLLYSSMPLDKNTISRIEKAIGKKEALWQDVSKYSNAEQIYSGEIGRLFGVVFVETTEGKLNAQSVLNAVNANTSSSATFVLKNDPTDAEVAYLSTGGNKIYIGSNEYTLASTGSYTPATKTVKLSATASLSANDIVYSKDCGAIDSTTKAGVTLHNSLIFGADAYGDIDIAGSGTLQTIIKPRGSAGTADPLDQRSTVGAKILGYTAKVLNPLWIINIHHAAHA